MRANPLLKANIDELLRRKRATRKDLAVWCYKSESWISHIYGDDDREIPSKHLDRIAAFFGMQAYQLFMPGIVKQFERRSARDRRMGHERRINDLQRQLQALDEEVQVAHPRRADEPFRISDWEKRVVLALRAKSPVFIDGFLRILHVDEADDQTIKTVTKKGRRQSNGNI